MNPTTFQSAKLRRVITVEDERLAARCALGRVVLIDDDPQILAALDALLSLEGYACEQHDSAQSYLQTLALHRAQFPGPCCVLCDVKMPELGGLELQQKLSASDNTPLLLMSGDSGAPEAVSAFRAGALDFLLKPIEADRLLKAVAHALGVSSQRQQLAAQQTGLAKMVCSLSPREREVARLVVRGHINQQIADQLGIALRTVKLHRQQAMEKLNVQTVADLVRLTANADL
ncbi:MAG: DNA-binding response regulator [Betaproteobacteria bacterium]|jgi:FixJ family two-component response regulator|nr:response regulator [Burkholderiales bacterium]NBX14128.1 DNA-binding response regulator [Betaproteobacteria bacterium]